MGSCSVPFSLDSPYLIPRNSYMYLENTQLMLCWEARNPARILASQRRIFALPNIRASPFLLLARQWRTAARHYHLDVFPFPPSSALPAVALWHGLNCARTPNDVLLLEQQRPRRRAAPLRSGHTIGLHGWWWRRSEAFWWNHRCRRASPW